MNRRPKRPKKPKINSSETNNIPREDSQLNYETSNRKKSKSIVIPIIIGILAIGIISAGVYFFATNSSRNKIVELEGQIESLNQSVRNKNETINELSDLVEDTTVKEVVSKTSLQRIEGSEVPKFYLVDGDFIAPNTLEIPTQEEDINDSFFQIGSRFRLVPSENWLVKSDGTTVELSHNTNIWGKIKATRHDEKIINVEDMKEVIRKFFEGYPSTTISYKRIFVGDNTVGMLGNAEIQITNPETEETKTKVVNVGFAQRGENTINILFLHDKENMVGQELINLLLSGTKYVNDNLKLE